MNQDLKYIFITLAVVLILGGGVLGYFVLNKPEVDVPPPPPSPGGLTEEERKELEEKLNPPGTVPPPGPGGITPPASTNPDGSYAFQTVPGEAPATDEEVLNSLQQFKRE